MSAPRLLLLIPPLTQLNTPYPSTAYLTGFLKRHGYATGEAPISAGPGWAGVPGKGPVSAGPGWAGVVAQADVGIEMVLALLSREGLTGVVDGVRDKPGELAGEAGQVVALVQA